MATCEKKPYPDKRSALMVLRAVARHAAARGRKKPTGAYLCSACRRWHLTSKSGTQTAPWERRPA